MKVGHLKWICRTAIFDLSKIKSVVICLVFQAACFLSPADSISGRQFSTLTLFPLHSWFWGGCYYLQFNYLFIIVHYLYIYKYIKKTLHVYRNSQDESVRLNNLRICITCKSSILQKQNGGGGGGGGGWEPFYRLIVVTLRYKKIYFLLPYMSKLNIFTKNKQNK